MIILGLVGTPAAGKSSAAAFLQGLGAEWINADLIARDCLNQSDVASELRGRFGDSIFDDGGAIVRSAVADLVFGDDSVKRENRRFLESVVHPRTRSEIHRRIVAAARQRIAVTLLDVPLLFESHWDLGCDAIWCIDATRENRLRRCEKRGWDAEELDRREANQLPIETKSRLSNHVMRNDATLDALHQKLRLHWEYLARMTDVAERSNPSGEVRGEGPAQSRHCTSDLDPVS